MSSLEGLRELTNEISSLLSEGGIRLAPQQNGAESPGPGLHSNSLPTLMPPSNANEKPHPLSNSSTPPMSTLSLSQHLSLPDSGVVITTTVPGDSGRLLPNDQGQGESPLVTGALLLNGDSTLSSRSGSRSSLRLPGDTTEDVEAQIKVIQVCLSHFAVSW